MCGIYSRVEGGIHVWDLLTCGRGYSHVGLTHVWKGAFTCGTYSRVEGTFTYGTYSRVEGAFTCGTYSRVGRATKVKFFTP